MSKKKPLRASMSFSPQEVEWAFHLINNALEGRTPHVPTDVLRVFEDKVNAMKLRIAEIRKTRDAS